MVTSEEEFYGEKNISGAEDVGGGGGGLFSDAEVEAHFDYLTEGVILTIVSCVGLGRRRRISKLLRTNHIFLCGGIYNHKLRNKCSFSMALN